MAIKDLQVRQGKVELVGTVTEIGEPREFQKFGNTGRVANAKFADETGEITLTLWNEQIDQVKTGAKVKISNGYVSEWQGDKQISTGRFGQMEVLEEGAAAPAKQAEEPKEVTVTPEELDQIEEEDFEDK
jgi:replication factor A1